MQYIITNGASYIKIANDRRPATTMKLKDAKVFDDEIKAQAYCACLPNTMKNLGFYVALYDVQEAPPPPPRIKRFDNPITKDAVLPSEDLDSRVLDIDYVASEMKRFENFVELVRSQKDAIKKQFAYAEAQIFDIEHAAELSNLNVCQGWKIYKALHDARCLRRKCKDSLDLISQIEQVISSGIITKEMSKKIDKLENRTFVPRAIPELFDDIRK